MSVKRVVLCYRTVRNEHYVSELFYKLHLLSYIQSSEFAAEITDDIISGITDGKGHLHSPYPSGDMLGWWQWMAV